MIEHGAHAVLGRQMYAREIRDSNLVRWLVTAYMQKAAAKNPAEWANKNEDSDNYLAEARALAKEYGLIDDL